jgi:site-specific DNA-methyltransferase (adenine-specific)
MVFDGHARKDRDPEQVWPVIVTDLTRAEADKMILIVDPLAAMAEVDAAKLDSLLQSIDTENDALQAMLDDLADAAGLITVEDITEDEIPEVPEEPITMLGDLWTLGDHRLLCGDATKPAEVGRLMDGEKADLWMTDPPYNVGYVGKTKKKLTVANDSQADDKFRTFLVTSFKAALEHVKPGGSFYIWHADSEGFNFRGAIHDCDERVRQCLIWKKQTLVMGRQDYHWIHEPCLYGWKDGAAHGWYSDRKQVTVLEFDRPLQSREHPTMKPVALFAYQIGNNTAPQGLIIDTFLGSGTTIIAAQQLGRRCFGMELSPGYCDVIVKRWEEFTGKKATRTSQLDDSPAPPKKKAARKKPAKRKRLAIPLKKKTKKRPAKKQLQASK